MGDTAALIETCRGILGASHVLTNAAATRRYRRGFRFGEGAALAVLRPGTLVEMWQVLQACVKAGVAVIAQASNTGLTGGSTPDGTDYGRPVVIISTARLRKVYVIDEGRQVVCLPGATLDQLEKTLKPLGREPHSVIGSSCIGASVIGGVCNNSGGSLVRRGPAYTELALYAQVDAQGRLALVNHLGIGLETEALSMLAQLDRGELPPEAIQHGEGAASDQGYGAHVRDIDAATPARYNADPLRLREASGSAGKLMVFAVRLDTFPIEAGARVFYIGTNRAEDLTGIRRHMLKNFSQLPIAGEYLHRDAYDIAERYGKDMFLLIEHLGTQRLPALFGMKSRCDAFFERFSWLPRNFTDRLMQAASRWFPSHLPARMKDFRQRYEHHLMLKVSADSVEETRDYLSAYFAARGSDAGRGDFFLCDAEEGRKAFLHRFAAAGAAVRYRAMHPDEVEDIVALDIALRRNDQDWVERLPAEMERGIAIKLYYGHFFCYVFHQDYIVRKGEDCLALEHAMWRVLDERGAEYPAEHNVGHLYDAKPALRAFYQGLDPCNCLNPGIGHMSKLPYYRDAEA
ncbi:MULTISPECIES: D-lactate dehydrogenase [unclassified Achromobacter]|uniref:D-lactate dehydrogenase n=1 Tax=unclassified Achromobacter TaxID=2626865 RepID=UPI000B51A043|nr:MULTISPECIES: D-lactate dehydrogenase [unclassified Achromobacter]OWT80441.1 D-lactate dehydrogenase [Achromobacter sp. HZ34]OWT82324.1 D-lactate dehydrogenase [Achromobacter sp. HZ28]